MSIIRVEHKRRYAVISSEVFKPNQLSWQAMGMLCFLLEKPDNWKVVVSYLIEVTNGTKKETGREGVYNIISELKEKGFITYKKNKDGSTDYTVYDEPIKPNQAEPNQAEPNQAEPNQAEPNQAEPTLINTDIKPLLILNKKTSRKSATENLPDLHTEKNDDAKASDADASVLSYSEKLETEDKPKRSAIPKWEKEALATLVSLGVDSQLANDYILVRKSKRASNFTNTSLNGLIREAKEAGVTLNAALTVCCERNWVGFKAEWYREGVRSGRIKPQGGLTSNQIGDSDGSKYGNEVTGDF